MFKVKYLTAKIQIIFDMCKKNCNKIKSFTQIDPYSKNNPKLLHNIINLTINNLTIAFFKNEQQASIIY